MWKKIEQIKQKAKKPSVYTEHMHSYADNQIDRDKQLDRNKSKCVKIAVNSTIALTRALTVWMYSKWPPSY